MIRLTYLTLAIAAAVTIGALAAAAIPTHIDAPVPTSREAKPPAPAAEIAEFADTGTGSRTPLDADPGSTSYVPVDFDEAIYGDHTPDENDDGNYASDRDPTPDVDLEDKADEAADAAAAAAADVDSAEQR